MKRRVFFKRLGAVGMSVPLAAMPTKPGDSCSRCVELSAPGSSGYAIKQHLAAHIANVLDWQDTRLLPETMHANFEFSLPLPKTTLPERMLAIRLGRDFEDEILDTGDAEEM